MKITFACLMVVMFSGCATKQAVQPTVKKSPPPKAILKLPSTAPASPPPVESAAAAIIGGYGISPTSASVSTTGGSGNILLTTPIWQAVSSDPSWLTVTPASGNGNTTLTWFVTQNNGAARSATLTIADQNFLVTQAGTTPPGTNAWIKRFGSTGTDYGSAVTTDAAGNIFVTGIFSLTVNFGGGDLTSAGSYDTFLCKFTSAGDLVWSKRFGGPNGEVAKAIALDPSGNIFVAGNLQSCSLLKFSPVGDLLWTAAPAGADFVSIATDSQGNVIATGNFAAPFSNPMDFGNGTMLFSQFGATDCFLAKYSSFGTCMFAKGFVNSGDAEYGYGVKLDHSDNILLAGYGTGRINLGGADLTNNVYGNTFGFLGKFQSSGSLIWSRRLGVTASTNSIGSAWSRVKALAVDANGDVILGGDFHLLTNLAGEPVDGGAAWLTGTSSYYDDWAAKYLGANGAYQWSVPVKGNQYVGINSVFSAPTGFLVAGYFYGTYTFGAPTGPQATLTAAGPSPKYNSDGFLMRLNSAGGFVSAQQFGGPLDADNGKSVSDTTVLTGGFQGTANFGAASLTSAGGQDIVLWKLAP